MIFNCFRPVFQESVSIQDDSHFTLIFLVPSMLPNPKKKKKRNRLTLLELRWALKTYLLLIKKIPRNPVVFV